MIAEGNPVNYQKVSLHDVEVELKLGIAGWERHKEKKQRVLVDVDLFRLRGKFTGKSIRDCVNYDLPFKFITQTWSRRAHTDLLETFVEELIVLCLKDKTIDAVRVSIRKPHVYNGRATPGVEFFRMRETAKTKKK